MKVQDLIARLTGLDPEAHVSIVEGELMITDRPPIAVINPRRMIEIVEVVDPDADAVNA